MQPLILMHDRHFVVAAEAERLVLSALRANLDGLRFATGENGYQFHSTGQNHGKQGV